MIFNFNIHIVLNIWYDGASPWRHPNLINFYAKTMKMNVDLHLHVWNCINIVTKVIYVLFVNCIIVAKVVHVLFVNCFIVVDYMYIVGQLLPVMDIQLHLITSDLQMSCTIYMIQYMTRGVNIILCLVTIKM